MRLYLLFGERLIGFLRIPGAIAGLALDAGDHENLAGEYEVGIRRILEGLLVRLIEDWPFQRVVVDEGVFRDSPEAVSAFGNEPYNIFGGQGGKFADAGERGESGFCLDGRSKEIASRKICFCRGEFRGAFVEKGRVIVLGVL